MATHHPEDDLLLRLAAGHAGPGESLLLHAHLERCAQCCARLEMLEALGGMLLEDSEPQWLAADALARTMARIEGGDVAVDVAQAVRPEAAARPPLPEGATWPQALTGREVSAWKWIAPGMHFARVATPDDAQGSVYLLRIAPGRSLARHTHTGSELTQVLCGAFDDGRALFARGDFDAADADVHHLPAVDGGDVCVCLTYVRGRLAFDGVLASMVGRVMGL